MIDATKPLSIIVEQDGRPTPLRGRLLQASAAALTIEGNGSSTVVNRNTIVRITSLKPAARTFAKRGALIGAALALATIALADSQSGQFDLWQLSGDAGMGAAIGAIAGHGKSIRHVLYQCQPGP